MWSRFLQIKLLCCSKELEPSLSIILVVLHTQFFLCQRLIFLIFPSIFLNEAKSNLTLQNKLWYYQISYLHVHESCSNQINLLDMTPQTTDLTNRGTKQELITHPFCQLILCNTFQVRNIYIFNALTHINMRNHWGLLSFTDFYAKCRED